jgi:hypothetical protein
MPWSGLSLQQVFSYLRRSVCPPQLRPSTNSVPRGTVTHPLAHPRPHSHPGIIGRKFILSELTLSKFILSSLIRHSWVFA